MDEVMAFAWANSPSMDIPFSDKSMALRASPNGYPALVIREVQMDDRAKVFNESGHGYWMEGCGTLRAEGENRPSRPGHIVILNDQGGAVMDVSYDKTATLRVQDHGHPPVVCLNFQGSKSNNVCTEDGTCYSMNAMHGHDVHVVCFEPGIMSRDCSAFTLQAGRPDDHHISTVCYAVDSHPTDSRMKIVGGGVPVRQSQHTSQR